MDLTGWISTVFPSQPSEGITKESSNSFFGVLPFSVRKSDATADEVAIEEPQLENADKKIDGPWDYCIVFKNDEVGDDQYEQSEIGKATYYALLEAGLEVYAYMSVQDDEMLILVRAPASLLAAFADQFDYKIALDETVARERLTNGGSELNDWGVQKIKGVEINEDPAYGDFYGAFQYIYGPYKKTDPELFDKSSASGDPFTAIVRNKLMYYIFQAPVGIGGCAIPVLTMVKKKIIAGFFPCHNAESELMLEHAMAWSTMPWDFPLDQIRAYFGEKFAFLFVFTGHFARSLIYPSIVGFCFQFLVWCTGPRGSSGLPKVNNSHPSLPFYSVIIAAWSIVMLEYWKQAQARQALFWGMTDYENDEPVRAEFEGEEIPSFIDGEPYMYYPASKYEAKKRITSCVVYSYILSVIAALAGIYAFKRTMTGFLASAAASLLNSGLITISNIVFKKVAEILTDLENHRTDTIYEDALVTKIFSFQFVNSFASFFYIAFIAKWMNACNGASCMDPLNMNLGLIFGSRLFATNTIEMLTPWAKTKFKFYQETKGVDPAKLTPAERDYILSDYPAIPENVFNYSALCVDYGYMVLFVVALPISPFLCIINCYVKLKFVLWKQVKLFQRPVPLGCQDIGPWEAIFTLISQGAVVTNAALIVFTMDLLNTRTDAFKFWVFIGFQWALFLMQIGIEAIIDDIPEEVEVQTERMKFIVDKLIFKVPDEDADEPPDENRSTTSGEQANHFPGEGKIGAIKRKYASRGLAPIMDKPIPAAAASADGE